MPRLFGLQQAPGRSNDLFEAAGDLEPAQVIRLEPFVVVEFVIEHHLTGDPARRKRHDQVMAAARNRRHDLAPAGETDDFDVQPGFLPDFALQGGVQGLAKFDTAARQRLEALGGRSRAPYQQDLVFAENRCTDGKLRMRRMERWRQGMIPKSVKRFSRATNAFARRSCPKMHDPEKCETVSSRQTWEPVCAQTVHLVV